MSDVPVNNAGAGNIDGIGIGEKGEPGVKRKKLRQILLGMVKRPELGKNNAK
jgi:hypothetical protein